MEETSVNSLCLFAAISRYFLVYVMAFTKVTRPCFCSGSLETSFNQLSCLEFFFLPRERQHGCNNPVKTEKQFEVVKIQIHVLFKSFAIWKVFEAIFLILV